MKRLMLGLMLGLILMISLHDQKKAREVIHGPFDCIFCWLNDLSLAIIVFAEMHLTMLLTL